MYFMLLNETFKLITFNKTGDDTFNFVASFICIERYFNIFEYNHSYDILKNKYISGGPIAYSK